MYNLKLKYIFFGYMFVLFSCSCMYPAALWTTCCDTFWAPFTFMKAVKAEFYEEFQRLDVNKSARGAGAPIGRSLARSITGIPDRLVNSSVDQVCALVVQKVPWLYVSAKVYGYMRIPDWIRNYLSPPHLQQPRNNDRAIIVPETDEEFIKRIPLENLEKNVLKTRLDQATVMGDKREKASLAVIKSLPWNKYTSDTVNVNQAKEILDKNHYGLDSVKEVILDYVAVCCKNKHASPPILCIAGPPGVGKTSMTKAIAHALNRQHELVACGGITDKARFMGISPAYVGAQEGFFIKALKKVNTMNPVIVLDEVDKMPEGVMSALLEVLDIQQNKVFRDHFIDIPCDLSKVLFVITVNDIQRLPHSLQDRMRIITVPPLKVQEKLTIAKKFLLPKVIKEVGLEPYTVQLEKHLDDTLLRHIIVHYTEEAGVRGLVGVLQSLCSRITRIEAETNALPHVTIENVHNFINTAKKLSRQPTQEH